MTTEVDERIIQLRDQLDFSQRDLAGALEVRQATISAWETGSAEPSRGNLRLLADLCHDSRTVYRWLLGKGPRPRLQPYREDREEQSDPAATYEFEDERASNLQATAEELEEQLEDSQTGRSKPNLPSSADTSRAAELASGTDVHEGRKAVDH